jgi:hypothetical protein
MRADRLPHADLESGHYVPICNLVEFDFDQAGNLIEVRDSHYERGMRTGLLGGISTLR